MHFDSKQALACEAVKARTSLTFRNNWAKAGSILGVWCFSWLGNPGRAFGMQGGPPSQGGQQSGTVSAPDYDERPELQETKLAAIEEAAGRNDRQALRRYLRDFDAGVQAAAFDALSAQDATSALGDLLAVMKDTNFPARWQALQILDQSPQVEEHTRQAVLRSALADPDALLSDYAAQALAARVDGPLDSGDSSEEGLAMAPQARSGDRHLLREKLNDTDAAVQAAAFEALAAHDAGAAVQELIAHVQDRDAPNRWQALRLLDQSLQGDERTVTDALRQALKDPDALVSDYAFEALVRREKPEGISSLMDAFRSGDALKRLLVIERVGQTEEGSPFLRRALSDPDEKVRAAAAALLQGSQAGTTTTQQQ